jgi:hypothetical protein
MPLAVAYHAFCSSDRWTIPVSPFTLRFVRTIKTLGALNRPAVYILVWAYPARSSLLHILRDISRDWLLRAYHLCNYAYVDRNLRSFSIKLAVLFSLIQWEFLPRSGQSLCRILNLKHAGTTIVTPYFATCIYTFNHGLSSSTTIRMAYVGLTHDTVPMLLQV